MCNSLFIQMLHRSFTEAGFFPQKARLFQRLASFLTICGAGLRSGQPCPFNTNARMSALHPLACFKEAL